MDHVFSVPDVSAWEVDLSVFEYQAYLERMVDDDLIEGLNEDLKADPNDDLNDDSDADPNDDPGHCLDGNPRERLFITIYDKR